MPKIIIGRKVTYLEVYEVDTDKFSSIRNDLDSCNRIICCSADPIISQQLRSYMCGYREKSSAIRFLNRTMDYIDQKHVYPVPDYPEGLDEAPRIKEE